ncbi:MAG: SulP family inorganic anion transporter [Myxococcaceae bacterium]|nr:SulP family inorganic anion transporter [Myxococcaceae bacterium]
MAEKVDTVPVAPPVVLPWGDLLHDLRAGLVVFLVALPLCLGVASACNVPPLAGLIAGVIGGTLVSMASGSSLTVAGPAAGLTIVVLDGVRTLGFRQFLLAGLIAGATQVLLGVIGAGRLAQVVPSAVIRGMLAAIGLILVLKQLPHTLGYDADPGGDFSFALRNGQHTFSELFSSLDSLVSGAVVVSGVAGLSLILWRNYPGLPLLRIAPREVMAVLSGLLCGVLLEGTPLELTPEHRVRVPSVIDHGLAALWTMPEWTAISRWAVWKTGFTLALVASIESLLCLEATDRIDPQRRWSPPNRELIAQGLGNVVSSSLGGMPIAGVVVRSFTNVTAGARSRLSSLTQGVLLLAATLMLAPLLNRIPLAALAVLLMLVGYRLTPVELYVEIWRRGRAQFWPFIVTVAAILLTDLVTGTLLGFLSAICFFVWGHYRTAIVVTDDGRYRLIRFTSSVSFLHKARLKAAFESAPKGGVVVLDGSRARIVDPDIVEAILDFEQSASARGIELTIQRSPSALHSYFREGASS